ncbi:MAG: glycogen/starch synthase, partial [Anaerovoracaceae bacterium]
MHILYIATECAPFAKSGGLGDVLGSLPQAIAKEGMQVSVLLPLYAQISETYRNRMEFVDSTVVTLSWRKQY